MYANAFEQVLERGDHAHVERRLCHGGGGVSRLRRAGLRLQVQRQEVAPDFFGQPETANDRQHGHRRAVQAERFPDRHVGVSRNREYRGDSPMTGFLTQGLLAVALLASSLTLTSPAPSAAQQATNRDAQTLADFQARVKNYLALRQKLMAGRPALPDKATPEQIEAHQRAVGDLIIAARKGARKGDLFSGEMTVLARRLLGPIFKGPGRCGDSQRDSRRAAAAGADDQHSLSGRRAGVDDAAGDPEGAAQTRRDPGVPLRRPAPHFDGCSGPPHRGYR